MIRSLNTAGAGMVAQQYNLDVIANNLANVNTTGFKGQRAQFQDMVYQTIRASGATTGGERKSPMANQVGLGSMFVGSSSNFTVGVPISTGKDTDVAISGGGFFQIERPDGTLAYTRDGSFQRDATGLLTTSDGFPISPNITIPADATALTISPNGAVSAILAGQNDPQPLGDIKLYMFQNPAGLTRVGQNLFVAGGGSGDAAEQTPGEGGSGSLTAGFLEGSNVAIVEEMVRMILAQRAYEINSKAVQTSDDMLQILNNLKR